MHSKPLRPRQLRLMSDYRAPTPLWLDGAHVLGDLAPLGLSAHHVATVRIGGWTYGFQDAGPQWVDQSGSTHEGGWPACLGVPAGNHVRIRFAAINVEAGGLGWRQVVMLDCRQV